MESTQQAGPVSTTLDSVMDEFRAGVTAILRSWSALRTAVEAGWGGVESVAKADDLRRILYEYFDGVNFPPKKITQEDLEDCLAIYMEEEFSIVLEDNSERQIAETIWRLYEAASKGDSSLASQVVAASNASLAQVGVYPIKVQTMEEDDDDDDDDDEPAMLDTDDSTPVPASTSPGVSAVEYSNESVFGKPIQKKIPKLDGPLRQLGEVPTEQASPVQIDEDGFAPVPTKRRTRNHA
jgi:pre-rRNA-processing protein TSR2